MNHLLILLLCLGSGFWAPVSAAEGRPNILFLFADDLGRYASAYADPDNPSFNDIVSTPTFDRIAKEGAIGNNVFVSAPSCSPCRAALVSGRHFFRNGSCSQLHHRWNSDVPDPWDDVKGYAKLLQASGYHIGLTHKNHVKNAPFGKQYSPAGRKVNGFSQTVSKAKDHKAAKKALYEECRGNFQAFLKDRKDGQPFLYSFHPTNPHRKWTKGSGKALWGLDPDSLTGKMPPFLPDVHTVREDLADYMGEGMAFDRCCEVLLEELEKTGEADNTLVIISGDHGAPGFPRGKTNCYDFGARVLFSARWPGKIKPAQVIDKPISLIDVAPTLLAAAGLPPEEGMNGQNLLPALAEADHSKLRGWALIGREVHVQTAREAQLPYPMRAIRTGDHLYIMNLKPDRSPMGDLHQLTKPKDPSFDTLANSTYATYPDVDAGPTKAWMVLNRFDPNYKLHWDLGFGQRPAEELYDLKTDPHQMVNLARNPDYEAQRSALNAQLMSELKVNTDPRLNGDQFDRPPYCKIGLRNGR